MATANPLEKYGGEDNFVLELSRVRERIESKFRELSDCLKARECELLTELDKILTSYHCYRRQVVETNKKKEELERTKLFHEKELGDSSVRELHEPVLIQVCQKLKSIETPIEPKLVHFVCDNTKLFDEVKKLGKLVERIFSVDYTSKKQPILSVCRSGYGLENLWGPQGVTVDNTTGNIYVADCGNNCVKVFDNTAKILFKFGDEEGEGKMNDPIGLAICGDRILISQRSDYILNYEVNGKFVSRIGKPGKGELEFNDPHGLTFDESNGEVYICDSNNNRIQILSKELTFKTQFGQDNLKYPRDVKLSKEFIFILDYSNPCLHLFNYNLILQKSVISRGVGLQLINPGFFCINISNNILISDYGSNSISIFNSQFELIHKISISYPYGVTVDNQGRVIIVCGGGDKLLHIF